MVLISQMNMKHSNNEVHKAHFTKQVNLLTAPPPLKTTPNTQKDVHCTGPTVKPVNICWRHRSTEIT